MHLHEVVDGRCRKCGRVNISKQAAKERTCLVPSPGSVVSSVPSVRLGARVMRKDDK